MATRVLVVDDNSKNVRLLTEILEDENYEVHSIDNGSDVVELVHQVKPQIILLDIMIPGIDGFEVCKRLKADYESSDIPVIMVTAKTDGADIKRALELGAFDYIKKPIDDAEVIARVQSALRFKAHQDRLKEMAMKDSLTGVYNHALIMEWLEKEQSRHRRQNLPMSFVMIDIDFFKKVNDTHGHQVGDAVLKGLAELLEACLRKGDIIGRYGGEEFGVILPEANSENAHLLCERLRQKIEAQAFATQVGPLKITVSMGISTALPDGALSTGEIVRRADSALYRAKESGRNRVLVYEGEMVDCSGNGNE